MLLPFIKDCKNTHYIIRVKKKKQKLTDFGHQLTIIQKSVKESLNNCGDANIR